MKAKLSGVRHIHIKGGYIRLDALLKFAAIADTGGMAKALIQNGDAAVNSSVCTERGKKVKEGDVVRIGGNILIVKSLPAAETHAGIV